MDYTYKITKRNFDGIQKRLESLIFKTRYCSDINVVKETIKEIKSIEKAFDDYQMGVH